MITDNGFDIAKNMNFEIVATGFDTVHPGATDGYMLNNGKIGIAVECGFLGESEENMPLAYDSILQFLQYFGIIDAVKMINKVKQKIINVDETQRVTSENFKLERAFDDFELILKGTLIASDRGNKYLATKERVILFAIPGKPIGAEAYVLGTWVKNITSKG